MKAFYTILLCMILMTSCEKNGYQGFPYSDSIYPGVPQTIPGKIQCEYYDKGGEGIAFHDMDSLNHGSGNLNKGTDYLNTFRIHEAVDISFTKFHDAIDNSAYNIVEPDEDQLYVGWTEPGEWTKYSVDVLKTGIYQVGIMYTANTDSQVSLSINDKNVTGPIDILSTFDVEDTVGWRQWHHWNYMNNIAELELIEGVQTLTLHTVTKGQMNYDFLEFTLNKNNN